MFWPFERTEDALAVCNVCAEETVLPKALIFEANPEQYDRFLGYGLAWQALSFYQKHKTEPHRKKDVIAPSPSPLDVLRRTLLSECFAALLIEQSEEKGFFRRYMKKCSELSITANEGYIPENHPYPIVFDSIGLILKDMAIETKDMSELIQNTLLMVNEINETYDDITLKQWVQFCYGAQEMAWMGLSARDILGAASYHSDSAYVRTTAHLIAESLNTDVVPLKSLEIYNPFADQERFERAHAKVAMARFEQILGEALVDHEPEILLKEAMRQNEAFMKGEIIGWCAPALVKTCLAYGKDDVRPALLRDIFEGAFHAARWGDIRLLNRFVMKKKRQGTEPTPAMIVDEFIGEHERLQIFKNAFSDVC